MKNDLDVKNVHKYGSAKFQPTPLFSSLQIAIEHAESMAEEELKQQKSRQIHRGSRLTGHPIGMPQWDAMQRYEINGLQWLEGRLQDR